MSAAGTPEAITGVTRWRKKPVAVSAIQWTGDNFAAVKDFASGALGAGEVMGGNLPLWVVKSSALCHVERGGWIIREMDGSGFYPCTADQFAATYEPAPPVAAALDRRTADIASVEAATAALERRYPGGRPDRLDDLLEELRAVARAWRRQVVEAQKRAEEEDGDVR